MKWGGNHSRLTRSKAKETVWGVLHLSSWLGPFRRHEQLRRWQIKMNLSNTTHCKALGCFSAMGAEQHRAGQEDCDILFPNKPSCSEETSFVEGHCDTHRTNILQLWKQTNQPYFKEMTVSQESRKCSKRNTKGDFNHISLLHFSLLKGFHQLCDAETLIKNG